MLKCLGRSVTAFRRSTFPAPRRSRSPHPRSRNMARPHSNSLCRRWLPRHIPDSFASIPSDSFPAGQYKTPPYRRLSNESSPADHPKHSAPPEHPRLLRATPQFPSQTPADRSARTSPHSENAHSVSAHTAPSPLPAAPRNHPANPSLPARDRPRSSTTSHRAKLPEHIDTHRRSAPSPCYLRRKINLDRLNPLLTSEID